MIKVLLVDDDKMSGTLLKALLEKREIECTYLNDAKKVLEHIKEKSYDIVLLDIMMPNISGLELLTEIRKHHNLYDLPVIMVTSKDEAEDIVSALKIGANDYLTKPVNIEIAVARINTQAHLKELVNKSLFTEQMQTITTLMTTLHHEINNPLAIVVGNLSMGVQKITGEKVEKSLSALSRISEILKQIAELGRQQSKMQEKNFGSKSKMYDLKKN